MNSRLPPMLERWITPRKLQLELLLVLLTVLSLLAFYSGLDNGQILMIAMTTLAIFYFISGYFTPDLEGNFGLVIYRISYIGCSVIVLGVLFTLLKYEGADQMLLIGGISIAVMFVTMIIYGVNTSSIEKVRPYLIRIVAMGVVYAVLKFASII